VPQIPCPNCGELLTCREEAIGSRLRCPRCRVMLRLDADAEGRPAYERTPAGASALRSVVLAIVFVAGLGAGFMCGWTASMARVNSTVSATSVGVFSASNTVVVAPPKAPPAAAAVKPPVGGPVELMPHAGD
jgi:hypothetical protein